MNKKRTVGNMVLLMMVHLIVLKPAYTQDQEQLVPEIDTVTNYYLQLSPAYVRPLYRDFATSPLFYSGVGYNISTAWLKRSDARERLFHIGMGFNYMFARVPQSEFIQPKNEAFFYNLNLRYHQLWRLESLSNNKNNFKLGGTLITTHNLRNNPSLQNNGYGAENITNVMASVQITRDVSRREPKTLNPLQLKPKIKAAKRDLRFLLNVGVLNFNYRPGYAYSYVGQFNGLETFPVFWLFSNYKWSLNGWRLNTELEYIAYHASGNAHSWSYVWDVAHAPGRYEAFQMASHQIKFTYYFHRKK